MKIFRPSLLMSRDNRMCRVTFTPRRLTIEGKPTAEATMPIRYNYPGGMNRKEFRIAMREAKKKAHRLGRMLDSRASDEAESAVAGTK